MKEWIENVESSTAQISINELVDTMDVSYVYDRTKAWSTAARSNNVKDSFSRMPFLGPMWAKVILTMFSYIQVNMSLCCGPDSAGYNTPYFGHSLYDLVITGNPPTDEK